MQTTVIHTGAGVDLLLYDYGAPTDCGGIVPAPEDIQPVSAAIDAGGAGCPPPLTDESGVIALGAGGTPPIGQYMLLTNDLDAGVIATFNPGVPFTKLRAEPSGFSAAVEDNLFDGTFEPGDGGWTFTRFRRDGSVAASVRRELNPADSSAVAPLPDGGYALLVGEAASGQYSLQEFQTGPAGSAVIIDAADAGVLRLLAGADQEGHLLMERGRPETPAACGNRWYDLDGAGYGDCYTGYCTSPGGIRSLLGAVSVRCLQPDNPPDIFMIIPDPGAQPSKAPDLYRQWTVVRHGTAYANWGERCIGRSCSFTPGTLDLLSRSGTKCATLLFRDTNLFVGRDGTVIEQSSCSYRWFPQLLR